MSNGTTAIPDHTAIRVALWRALHVQIDSLPHVLNDETGLLLANPDENWRQRGDMHPQGTSGYRASIVGRARVIEDLVKEQVLKGITQYVVLGAGLDTFAQRHPDLASKIHVFEVDKPDTQAWKRNRLLELGFGIPDHLKLVPVDFEAGESWKEKLIQNGFDQSLPAVVASTGVSMYLSKEANLETFREVASLARGTSFAMSFLLPLELIDVGERAQHEMVYERARASGTPFISFFNPAEIVALASEAGFRDTRHISRSEIIRRYFTGRSDGLVPSSGEEILIAST